MKSSDIDEVGITGGYLIEMDTYYDEVNKFKSEICDLPVMLKEPEEDVLQEQQFEYIQNYINTIEQALYSDDFAKTREYASYISDTTFIDFWFVTELTNNRETAYPKSSYFYKDRSKKLKAGPMWDFDWGTFTTTSGFCIKDALWYSQLFKDPAFVRKVKERWDKLKPSFKEVALSLEETAIMLSISVELNDEMWSLQNARNINGDERMSHRDAVLSYLKKNYENRIEWLDTQIQQLK